MVSVVSAVKISGSRGQLVGYICVSTVEQNNQRQKELLANCSKIDRFFEDKISGRTKTARPGLGECMAYVRDGDELVVSSIDRLARSLADLRGIVDVLTGKGVTVTFLHENLAFAKNTRDPRADLMLDILGSFAEIERAIIRGRQAEGIALAKKAESTKAASLLLARNRWRRLSGACWRGSRKQRSRENSGLPGLPCTGHPRMSKRRRRESKSCDI